MTHSGLHGGRSVTQAARGGADSTCLGQGYLLTHYQKGRHGNTPLASLPLAAGALMTSSEALWEFGKAFCIAGFG